MKKRNPMRAFIEKIAGLAVFLLILFAADYLKVYFDSPIYAGILSFFKENLGFIVGMSLIFLIGAVLMELSFPFSLPGPVFNAVGSILIVTFLRKVFLLIDTFTGADSSFAFRLLSFIIYPIVFLFVLVGGYASLFFRTVTYAAVQSAESKPLHSDKVVNVKKVKTWEDVGKEFKEAFSDFFDVLKREFCCSKKKKNKG